MPSLRDVQDGFARAIFTGEEGDIAQVVESGTLDPAQRLDVYRNNVLSNYRNALRDTYPMIVRLVGDEFFNAAARVYARQTASMTGDLHDYGETFGDFLEDFPPARELPYLGEVARLEWAMHRVFHAVDVKPLTPSAFATISVEHLPLLRFTLSPAARLIESKYPVARIWRISQPEHAEDDVSVSLDEGGERVLVIRPDYTVELETLTEAEYAMLDALAQGQALGMALEAAMMQDAGFDLGAFLTHHVTRGTFSGIKT